MAKKKIISMVLAAAMVLAFIHMSIGGPASASSGGMGNTGDPHAWTMLSDGLVAHALGSIDGHDYTNSYEALTLNYGLGHRVFEADLNLTTDGELAVVHDWHGYSGQKSSDEWRSVRIAYRYTAIMLQDILDFMVRHPDMYLVTDTKSFEYSQADMITQFQVLYTRAYEAGGTQLLNRIIPQIYN